MTNSKAPLANILGLHLPEYPVPIRIGSPGWINWLECNRKFRFECDYSAKFTAYKSDKGYWTAQRRYNGKLRHEYLGDSRHLDWDKLESVAKKLNMGDSAYWNDKYPSPVLTALNNGRSPSLIPDNYETVAQPSLKTQADISPEALDELIKERDDYRDTVDALIGDCERYQKRIKELEAKLTTEKRDQILAALGVGKQSDLYKRVKSLLEQVFDSVP
jgi:hypothetical protein